MKIAATVLCLLALVLTTEAGPDSKMIVMPKNEPTWSFEAQTAVLFGVQNRNDYILAPQILSGWWRPADPRWGGVELGLAAIVEPVIQGPESFLGGGAITFRYTWRSLDWPVKPYFTARLGCGAIDSRRALDGQGQDFVFLAQGEGGLRAELTRSLSLQGGILYQHMSNAGLSEPEAPNVGLDAFGPFIGLRWEF